jgi:hypothetical protein
LGPTIYDSSIGFQLQQEDYAMLGRQVVAAWGCILHRAPTEQETDAVGRFVAAQLDLLYRQPDRLSSGNSASRQVLINICQMLLNSNEFLYVD